MNSARRPAWLLTRRLRAYPRGMSLESALLDLVLTDTGAVGDRWLGWLVQGGAPPRCGSTILDVVWPLRPLPL